MKTRGNVSVELEWIGEGLCGDYDEEDEDDVPLMRFTYYHNGEQVEDGSYCTGIEANISDELLEKVEEYLLHQLYDDIVEGNSIKKAAERLTWLKYDDGDSGITDLRTGSMVELESFDH